MPVGVFGLLSWPGLLDLLDDQGPAGVLRRVRDAERGDPDGRRWRRNKISDDATIAYLDFR